MVTMNDIPDQVGEHQLFRVLSLDGGGSKGMFSVGALIETEAMLKKECYELFDLVYGTSVGSIIAALIATRHSAERIRELFLDEIPEIMRWIRPARRSQALQSMLRSMFQDQGFDESGLATKLGIVATRTDVDRPMIFKTSSAQVIRGAGSFIPGFGATLAEAVMASCAARPFFNLVSVPTGMREAPVDAIDGGFVANNPSLFALIDAIYTLRHPTERVALLSVGAGSYPLQFPWYIKLWRRLPLMGLLETTLSANTNAMQILTEDLIFKNVRQVRIDKAYSDRKHATSLLEADPRKLDHMVTLGRDAFREKESEVTDLLG